MIVVASAGYGSRALTHLGAVVAAECSATAALVSRRHVLPVVPAKREMTLFFYYLVSIFADFPAKNRENIVIFSRVKPPESIMMKWDYLYLIIRAGKCPSPHFSRYLVGQGDETVCEMKRRAF